MQDYMLAKEQINFLGTIFKRFSDIRIYKHALKLFGSEIEADAFMLSKQGGYTESQLNRIKYRINYYENKKHNPS